MSTPVPDPVSNHVPSLADRDGQVTYILHNWERVADPADALLPLVYEQLRAIAANRMRGERRDHTLQATALVHEAYLKLVGLPSNGVSFDSRARFFSAAAEAMRRILIDHARKRSAAKREAQVLPIDSLLQEPAQLSDGIDPDDLLALDEALQRFAREDPAAAEIVRLRYFAGLSAEETAEVLSMSLRTLTREWSYARARLNEMLHGD